MKQARSSLLVLLWITLINYVAQIPYYLHNYYFPYHELPTMSAVILLGSTLVWFFAGYVGIALKWKPGYWILLSFLTVEALFYARTILLGTFIFQLQNPSWLIKLIFVIGYISGIAAGYYAYILLRFRKRFGVGSD